MMQSRRTFSVTALLVAAGTAAVAAFAIAKASPGPQPVAPDSSSPIDPARAVVPPSSPAPQPAPGATIDELTLLKFEMREMRERLSELTGKFQDLSRYAASIEASLASADAVLSDPDALAARELKLRAATVSLNATQTPSATPPARK